MGSPNPNKSCLEIRDTFARMVCGQFLVEQSANICPHARACFGMWLHVLVALASMDTHLLAQLPRSVHRGVPAGPVGVMGCS